VPGGFTIAIPTHNRRETTLLALRSALAQTRPPERVIVLCDGCTDGTAEAARGLGDDRVEAIELPKLPGFAYEHRNLALEVDPDDGVMWLADDDMLLPDHLERVGEYWDSGLFEIVQTPAVLILEDDSLGWLGQDWSVPQSRLTVMERHNTNVLASVLVRAGSARDAGGWDGSLPRLGDWELWKRMMAGGARTAMTSEPTVLHLRATGREQSWPERVSQNTRWFQRIVDPEALAELRWELRVQRGVAEARMGEQLIDLAARIEQAEVERERLAAAEGEIERMSAELARQGAELDYLRGVEQTLFRIYAGGWWRLRGRLSPALRLAARLRRPGG
jgi:glycosyltransferase involved in cell wall biosynthesis